jgi:hypothetical protein
LTAGLITLAAVAFVGDNARPSFAYQLCFGSAGVFESNYLPLDGVACREDCCLVSKVGMGGSSLSNDEPLIDALARGVARGGDLLLLLFGSEESADAIACPARSISAVSPTS